MAVGVFLAGVLLAGCGAANLRGWIALAPRTVARQVGACLVFAVLFSYVGLALLAAPALFGLWQRSGLTALCRRLLAGPGPLGALGACLAAGLIVASACALLARVRRSRRERRELWIEHGVGRHECGPGYDLVTLPSPVPLAYCLAGREPQVVLSQGLRGRLGERELAAVVAHEAAHLRGRHERWLGVATVLETALWFAPWARSAGATVRLSLERWADEEAARSVGRDALRSALLAAADAAPLPSQTAGLTRPGALAQRLAVLADPGRDGVGGPAGAGWGWLALSVATGLTVSGGLAAFVATLATLCSH